MNKRKLNFGMMALIATAFVFTSCEKDNKHTVEKPKETEATFNVIYRVTGTGALADWALQPFNEAQMKQGNITFANKGFNLANERTHEMYSTNNGKTVYVFSSMTRLITKYEVTGGTGLYSKIDQIDATPIIGNTFGNFKVLDEKNAVVYNVSSQNVVREGAYVKTVATLKIGRVNLENFTGELRDMKTITLPEIQATPEMINAYIYSIANPVLHNGKLYFGMQKRGYDPTKQGRAAQIQNEDAYQTTTLVMDFPSFNNLSMLSSALGKGASAYASVFYGPSYIKAEDNSLYHITTHKGGIYKIVNGAYDNSYELNLKEKLGLDSDVAISGIHYAANGIAYVTYAPWGKVLEGGLIYQDGKAVWGVARVDLNAKTAIKMNVTENLWLTFYQNAKFVSGKLYMALCPMTGNGNVYIFDPTKANANGFEIGATLESAGGAIYLGIF